MSELFDFGQQAMNEYPEDDREIITVFSSDEDESNETFEIPEILPILPLRNTVIFPGVIMPITVGRDKSITLIREANKSNKTIGIIGQKDASIEDPGPDDLYKVGTVSTIIRMLQMPDGSTTVIIQGKRRFVSGQVTQTEPYLKATVTPFMSKMEDLSGDKNFEALVASLKDLSMQIIKLSPNIPSDASFALKNIENPSFLINFISSNLNVPIEEKQKLLELDDIQHRAKFVLSQLTKEMQYLELKNQIQSKVKHDLDRQQREYYLHQQIKTIQEELGGDPHEMQVNEMIERSKKKAWPEKVADVFSKEIAKLKRMNPAAAEYSIQVNYAETLLDLPWNDFTTDNLDLDHAQKILDRDHFGLEKIKERIIEYLAVLKLKNDMKSPILCLVGPPGVGKTSLGKSVAESLGRSYVRMSLGGMRDEAEIRGHRKTYIGAMPGRLIQSIRKAKSSNPVFILDEIDKVGSHSIHGDPSSALLEALDPEQNHAFYDNYLEIEYDFSKVMFIATANTLTTLHPALRDRMEVIDLHGYILEEKIEIAKRHLIPKLLTDHGVKKTQISFPPKTIEKIIEDYTRESGVRALEKRLAKAMRYTAKFIASDKPYSKRIDPSHLTTIFGAPQFQHDKSTHHPVPGVVTGLAWTPVGGEILFIEASLSAGKGNLALTGNLGDVMKESAVLALEYIRSNALDLSVSSELFDKLNVHIHVPEGATPKDGPSAGIAMFTALVSVFTQRLVNKDIAMTGEITLRGRVLPVGGIKEKILAARRAGIKDIILSEENRKDIDEIRADYLSGLSFHYITEMKELIPLTLQPGKFKAAKDLVAIAGQIKVKQCD
ncbi:MAG: endopeptidase La [Bacteroidetes bacterium]|nr:endopeptidase La [Bacteroidota bacterium]